MAILIRTSDIPAAQRHDAWRNVVCDTLGPLDFRSDPGTPLRGEITAGQLGPVNVGRVKTSTPHSVYRTAGLIRRDSRELYRVALTMSGRACLLQDGRTAQLRPGEFTLYDFTRPYELAYDSGVQLAVFSFPREMLTLPADLVAKLTAVPVRTDAGTGALAAPYPAPFTGCWRARRTTWRRRPSSPSCWNSSSRPDRPSPRPTTAAIDGLSWRNVAARLASDAFPHVLRDGQVSVLVGHESAFVHVPGQDRFRIAALARADCPSTSA